MTAAPAEQPRAINGWFARFPKGYRNRKARREQAVHARRDAYNTRSRVRSVNRQSAWMARAKAVYAAAIAHKRALLAAFARFQWGVAPA